MNPVIKLLIFSLLLVCTIVPADGQTKKTNKPKPITQQKAQSPTFNSIEELNKWITQDSLKRAVEDSIDYIKDSIAADIENKNWSDKISQSWYPKDSLSYIDDIVQGMITEHQNIGPDGAVAIIKKRFASSLQQARAIFFWIASTISYDYNAFNNNLVMPIYDNDADAANTFRQKKGVCQNYANLYKYMCDKAGIECKFIVGLGKNFPLCINPQEESNHAWNCVKTNKGWMLLDATWARIDTNRVDCYWFNIPPDQFIHDHFPLDSSLQFLKKPVTRKQFLNYPIVSPFLFKSKLDFEIPDYGSFKLVSNKFSIGVPLEEKSFTIGYTIMPYKGDDWRPYFEKMEEQNLETKIIVNKKDKTVDYEVEIPAKGTWWLSVTLNKKLDKTGTVEISFPQVIILKITY